MQNYAPAVHGYDVESIGRVWCYELHVIGSEPAKGAAFSCIHSRKRTSVGAAPARFDFDEHDRVSVLTDQVDLAAGKAHVPAYDAVARLR